MLDQATLLCNPEGHSSNNKATQKFARFVLLRAPRKDLRNKAICCPSYRQSAATTTHQNVLFFLAPSSRCFNALCQLNQSLKWIISSWKWHLCGDKGGGGDEGFGLGLRNWWTGWRGAWGIVIVFFKFNFFLTFLKCFIFIFYFPIITSRFFRNSLKFKVLFWRVFLSFFRWNSSFRMMNMKLQLPLCKYTQVVKVALVIPATLFCHT